MDYFRGLSEDLQYAVNFRGGKKFVEIRKHYIQTNTVAKMDTFVLAHTYTIEQLSTFTARLNTL
jgi:hypothetical protein